MRGARTGLAIQRARIDGTRSCVLRKDGIGAVAVPERDRGLVVERLRCLGPSRRPQALEARSRLINSQVSDRKPFGFVAIQQPFGSFA